MTKEHLDRRGILKLMGLVPTSLVASPSLTSCSPVREVKASGADILAGGRFKKLDNYTNFTTKYIKEGMNPDGKPKEADTAWLRLADVIVEKGGSIAEGVAGVYEKNKKRLEPFLDGNRDYSGEINAAQFGVLNDGYLPRTMDFWEDPAMRHIATPLGIIISEAAINELRVWQDALPLVLTSTLSVREFDRNLQDPANPVVSQYFPDLDLSGAEIHGFSVWAPNQQDGIIFTTFNNTAEVLFSKLICSGINPNIPVDMSGKLSEHEGFLLEVLKADGVTLKEGMDFYLASNPGELVNRLQGERYLRKHRDFPNSHRMVFWNQLEILTNMVIQGMLSGKEAFGEWSAMTGMVMTGMDSKLSIDPPDCTGRCLNNPEPNVSDIDSRGPRQ